MPALIDLDIGYSCVVLLAIGGKVAVKEEDGCGPRT